MIRVGEIRDSEGLTQLLREFKPVDGPFVILPNWHCTTKGYGTDAQTLECLLGALEGHKVVIEAYDVSRTDDPARFREGMDLQQAWEHRDYLREQDQVFLRKTGIGDVLAEYGAEYANVTEEVWAGRTADPREVADLVEKRYGPVVHRELYRMVPRRLWDMRDATLINFAKIKAGSFRHGIFFSLSMKNLFGLIPLPNRVRYHGADNEGLSRSIVDMNQIYCSVFRVISVCEAMHNALISATAPVGNEAGLIEDLGLVAASDCSVELDAFLVRALGERPDERHFLRMGAQVFGGWNEECFPTLPPEPARRLREAMKLPGQNLQE